MHLYNTRVHRYFIPSQSTTAKFLNNTTNIKEQKLRIQEGTLLSEDLLELLLDRNCDYI